MVCFLTQCWYLRRAHPKLIITARPSSFLPYPSSPSFNSPHISTAASKAQPPPVQAPRDAGGDGGGPALGPALQERDRSPHYYQRRRHPCSSPPPAPPARQTYQCARPDGPLPNSASPGPRAPSPHTTQSTARR